MPFQLPDLLVELLPVLPASLQRSGSLSKPLSLRVIALNVPVAVVPLLSEPKLLKLNASLDHLPGVGEVGGESQLMSRSGAVAEEVSGS